MRTIETIKVQYPFKDSHFPIKQLSRYANVPCRLNQGVIGQIEKRLNCETIKQKLSDRMRTCQRLSFFLQHVIERVEEIVNIRKIMGQFCNSL